MRKVRRLPEPDSLKHNAGKWTRELTDEIRAKGSYSKADKTIKHKYRQEDVKRALEKMYKKHCCYCGSIIGISSFGRIEHLKPKSLPQFYPYTFDWENLHWCCEVCNTRYKREKWDFQYPILDPSKDDIDKFIKLNMTTGRYEEIGENRRARTTIDHTGMNRDDLVKARRRIIIRFLKDYKAHLEHGDEQEFCNDWQMLKEDMNFPEVYDELLCCVTK